MIRGIAIQGAGQLGVADFDKLRTQTNRKIRNADIGAYIRSDRSGERVMDDVDDHGIRNGSAGTRTFQESRVTKKQFGAARLGEILNPIAGGITR